jgi:hypothetical protein
MLRSGLNDIIFMSTITNTHRLRNVTQTRATHETSSSRTSLRGATKLDSALLCYTGPLLSTH